MVGRVTRQAFQRSTPANQRTDLDAMSDLHDEFSGNKRATEPCDDPAGTASALTLRSSVRQIEQHAPTISDGIGLLTTTDTALTTSVSVIGEARDVTVQCSDTGALTAEARESLAQEIEGLRDSLTDQTSTSYLGRSVIAGTANTDTAFPELSGVGARHDHVLAARSTALTHPTELTGQLGAVEDADLAASIVELLMQEVACEAALGAMSRVLQPTLMDFLR